MKTNPAIWWQFNTSASHHYAGSATMLNDLVSKVIVVLSISKSDFEVVTDKGRFEEILRRMLKSSEIDDVDFEFMLGMTDLPYAELTVPHKDRVYIYIEPRAADDVFTLLHALGHVYLFRRLRVVFSTRFKAFTRGACTDFDVKMYAILVDIFRNMFEDILADATIYSALLNVDASTAEQYWRYAASEMQKAVDLVSKRFVDLEPSFSELYAYATMLAESVYYHRRGLTKRTTEKLESYISSRGLREAIEFFDAVISEMAATTGYEIRRVIAKENSLTRYEIEVSATMTCVSLR